MSKSSKDVATNSSTKDPQKMRANGKNQNRRKENDAKANTTSTPKHEHQGPSGTGSGNERGKGRTVPDRVRGNSNPSGGAKGHSGQETKPVQIPGKRPSEQAVGETQRVKNESPKEKLGSDKPKEKSGNSQAPKKTVDFTRSDGELVSMHLARQICAVDAKAAVDDKVRKNFIASNQGQYYVAINVWLLIIQEAKDTNVIRRMIMMLQSFGLAKVIAAASTVADEIIASTKGDVDLPANSPDILVFFRSHFVPDDLNDPTQLGHALQLLRFLKRFTLASAPWLAKASEEALYRVLRRNNYYQHYNDLIELAKKGDLNGHPDPDPPCSYDWMNLRMRISGYLARMWRTFPRNYRKSGCGFSAGVCSDARDEVEKVLKLAEIQPMLEPLYPLSDNSFATITERETTVTPGPVPKNYKVYRMIAPESVRVAYHMQRVRKALELSVRDSNFTRFFDVRTQEPNRAAAQEGSISGDLVTLDLSMASDSIARRLAKLTYPADVWSAIEPYLPTAINICGKKVYPATFLTSGNPITFIGEGCLFVAILLACRDIYNESPFTEKCKVDPIVFGDDLIIPQCLRDTVLQVLEYLGFTVSSEKSFWEGNYRESCGVEYYHGVPCDSKYWPRRYVNLLRGGKLNATTESVSSLVSLQHRLFSYPRAAMFIEQLVLLLEPRMTYSFVGLETDDLWSEFPNPKLVKRNYDWDKVRQSGQTLPETAGLERHLTAETTKGNLNSLPLSQRQILERYDFYQYMQNGPRFADKLSELLGVSEPLRRVAPKGVSRFNYVYR